MDAYNGNYRIATTSGETWSDTSQNNIYVLDSSMKLKGKLEGLAPGERIFSARFMGERAYLVTFRQVDPFYVMNLKNPSQPAVLGYLKIPGFSDYLHPYDSNTIIGFGKDIIETANRPVVGGIKIAMFDVTDVSKPVEKQNPAWQLRKLLRGALQPQGTALLKRQGSVRTSGHAVLRFRHGKPLQLPGSVCLQREPFDRLCSAGHLPLILRSPRSTTAL